MPMLIVAYSFFSQACPTNQMEPLAFEVPLELHPHKQFQVTIFSVTINIFARVVDAASVRVCRFHESELEISSSS